MQAAHRSSRVDDVGERKELRDGRVVRFSAGSRPAAAAALSTRARSAASDSASSVGARWAASFHPHQRRQPTGRRAPPMAEQARVLERAARIDGDRRDAQVGQLPGDSGPQVQSGRAARPSWSDCRALPPRPRRPSRRAPRSCARSRRDRAAPRRPRRARPCATIASTARATTPFCAPTRPACTAATTPARASDINTGTQSAVTTANANRGVRRHQSVGVVDRAADGTVDRHDTVAVHLVHPDDAVVAEPGGLRQDGAGWPRRRRDRRPRGRPG